ncbi:hypothetical protein P7K49_019398 [Saguinus oedipus]|uniref:Mucin-19-like n=1 Tax=Saguinus oedipus TaxID=9490 RepID=A0ABQ9UXB1_SAGOE|nr:hypothetical protein P7K49_019398 [Saguinus oedipus]
MSGVLSTLMAFSVTTPQQALLLYLTSKTHGGKQVSMGEIRIVLLTENTRKVITKATTSIRGSALTRGIVTATTGAFSGKTLEPWKDNTGKSKSTGMLHHGFSEATSSRGGVQATKSEAPGEATTLTGGRGSTESEFRTGATTSMVGSVTSQAEHPVGTSGEFPGTTSTYGDSHTETTAYIGGSRTTRGGLATVTIGAFSGKTLEPGSDNTGKSKSTWGMLRFGCSEATSSIGGVSNTGSEAPREATTLTGGRGSTGTESRAGEGATASLGKSATTRGGITSEATSSTRGVSTSGSEAPAEATTLTGDRSSTGSESRTATTGVAPGTTVAPGNSKTEATTFPGVSGTTSVGRATGATTSIVGSDTSQAERPGGTSVTPETSASGSETVLVTEFSGTTAISRTSHTATTGVAPRTTVAPGSSYTEATTSVGGRETTKVEIIKEATAFPRGSGTTLAGPPGEVTTSIVGSGTSGTELQTGDTGITAASTKQAGTSAVAPATTVAPGSFSTAATASPGASGMTGVTTTTKTTTSLGGIDTIGAEIKSGTAGVPSGTTVAPGSSSSEVTNSVGKNGITKAEIITGTTQGISGRTLEAKSAHTEATTFPGGSGTTRAGPPGGELVRLSPEAVIISLSGGYREQMVKAFEGRACIFSLIILCPVNLVSTTGELSGMTIISGSSNTEATTSTERNGTSGTGFKIAGITSAPGKQAGTSEVAPATTVAPGSFSTAATASPGASGMTGVTTTTSKNRQSTTSFPIQLKYLLIQQLPVGAPAQVLHRASLAELWKLKVPTQVRHSERGPLGNTAYGIPECTVQSSYLQFLSLSEATTFPGGSGTTRAGPPGEATTSTEGTGTSGTGFKIGTSEVAPATTVAPGSFSTETTASLGGNGTTAAEIKSGTTTTAPESRTGTAGVPSATTVAPGSSKSEATTSLRESGITRAEIITAGITSAPGKQAGTSGVSLATTVAPGSFRTVATTSSGASGMTGAGPTSGTSGVPSATTVAPGSSNSEATTSVGEDGKTRTQIITEATTFPGGSGNTRAGPPGGTTGELTGMTIVSGSSNTDVTMHPFIFPQKPRLPQKGLVLLELDSKLAPLGWHLAQQLPLEVSAQPQLLLEQPERLGLDPLQAQLECPLLQQLPLGSPTQILLRAKLCQLEVPTQAPLGWHLAQQLLLDVSAQEPPLEHQEAQLECPLLRQSPLGAPTQVFLRASLEKLWKLEVPTQKPRLSQEAAGPTEQVHQEQASLQLQESKQEPPLEHQEVRQVNLEKAFDMTFDLGKNNQSRHIRHYINLGLTKAHGKHRKCHLLSVIDPGSTAGVPSATTVVPGSSNSEATTFSGITEAVTVPGSMTTAPGSQLSSSQTVIPGASSIIFHTTVEPGSSVIEAKASLEAIRVTVVKSMRTRIRGVRGTTGVALSTTVAPGSSSTEATTSTGVSRTTVVGWKTEATTSLRGTGTTGHGMNTAEHTRFLTCTTGVVSGNNMSPSSSNTGDYHWDNYWYNHCTWEFQHK